MHHDKKYIVVYVTIICIIYDAHTHARAHTHTHTGVRSHRENSGAACVHGQGGTARWAFKH